MVAESRPTSGNALNTMGVLLIGRRPSSFKVFFCFLFKLIGQFSILEDHMLKSISKSDSYHWCWHKLAHSYHLQVPKTLVIRCCTYINDGKRKVTQPHFKCRIQVIAIHKASGQGKQQGNHKRYSHKTPISTYPILPNSWMSLQSSVQYVGWSWHSIHALKSIKDIHIKLPFLHTQFFQIHEWVCNPVFNTLGGHGILSML
jgi:hypothetical protein